MFGLPIVGYKINNYNEHIMHVFQHPQPLVKLADKHEIIVDCTYATIVFSTNVGKTSSTKLSKPKTLVTLGHNNMPIFGTKWIQLSSYANPKVITNTMTSSIKPI